MSAQNPEVVAAVERLRHPASLEGPVMVRSEELRLVLDANAAAAGEVERLREERAFLLARANRAGSVRFGGGRWTGMSSNALVTIAFGGADECLPHDGSDLAACYRTLMRMPKHLLSKKVFAQLEKGERNVGEDDVIWARNDTDWPGAAALSASNVDEGAGG